MDNGASMARAQEGLCFRWQGGRLRRAVGAGRVVGGVRVGASVRV